MDERGEQFEVDGHNEQNSNSILINVPKVHSSVALVL